MATSHVRRWRVRRRCRPSYDGGPFCAHARGWSVACGTHVRRLDPWDDEATRIQGTDGGARHGTDVDDEVVDGGAITALWTSEDGETSAMASRNGVLKGFGAQWRVHHVPTCVCAARCDVDKRVVFVGCADGSVMAWTVEEKARRALPMGGTKQAHQGPVHAIDVDETQGTAVSVGQDGCVRFWSWKGNQLVHVHVEQGHDAAATDVDVWAEEHTAVSVARDGTAVVWDLDTRKPKRTVVADEEALETVAFLPSEWRDAVEENERGTGKRKKGNARNQGKVPSTVWYWTGGDQGKLRLWDACTGNCVAQTEVEGAMAGDGILRIQLVKEKKQLVCATTDGRVLCYQFFYNPKEEGRVYTLQLVHQLVGNNEEIVDLRFLAGKEEETLLAAATNSTHIHVYRTTNLDCVATLIGHQHTVLCLDVATIGNQKSLVASGSKDQTLKIWTLESNVLRYQGSCVATGEGHMGAVGAVAFAHPKGGQVDFVATAGADRLLKVWSLQPLAEERKEDMEIDLSPLALKATASIAAHDKEINTVAVAPNNLYLATGSLDKTVRVWKMPHLSLHVALKGHRRGIWSVHFSPIDKVLASASGDRTIRLWNLADGSCIRTLEGHTSSVLKCQFVSYGTQILSVGADGLLKHWEVRNGECISTFDEHEDKVWALCSNGEEQMLASGGGDSTIQIWRDETEQEEKKAQEEEVTRVMKEQELSNALKQRRFDAAAKIAFELDRPHNLLSVCTELLSMEDEPLQLLTPLVCDWSGDKLAKALEFVRDWTTNKRHCHIGQKVFQAILQTKSSEEIMKVPGIESLLEAIKPYTERHYSRIVRLIQSTFLLDMALASMNVLEADGVEEIHGGDAVVEPADPPDLGGSPVAFKRVRSGISV
uniref:U3 small nucleolar RNA-associated protein 13 C-terminal domain-containing protein n=1 Tax=Picocystis salinarum TaxID=88271 RepID=A0A7S3UF63_9CHLO